MATQPTGSPRARALFASSLLAFLGVPALCQAEIYGYVDSTGTFTYSNLPPPKAARVTDVIPEEVAAASGRPEANRMAQLAALNDRIRLLELENDRARRQIVDFAPPPAIPACGYDPNYGEIMDCGGGYGPYNGPSFYPILVPPAYYGGRAYGRGYRDRVHGWSEGHPHGGHGAPAHAGFSYGSAGHGSAGYAGSARGGGGRR